MTLCWVDCGGCLIDHAIQLSTAALPTKFSPRSIILLRCCLRGRTFRGGGRTRPSRELAGGGSRIGRMVLMVDVGRWALCDDLGTVRVEVSGGFMAFGCMVV